MGEDGKATLDEVIEIVTQAQGTFDVFGDLGGDNNTQKKNVIRRCVHLARAVYPIDYLDNDDLERAQSAFDLLMEFYDQARLEVLNRTYPLGHRAQESLNTKTSSVVIRPGNGGGDARSTSFVPGADLGLTRAIRMSS